MNKKQALTVTLIAVFLLIAAPIVKAESTFRMYVESVLEDNPQVKVQEFEEDGVLRCENPVNKNEKVNGVVLHYNKEGNLFTKTPYFDGLANGERKQYDTNSGTLEWVVPYKNGKENGVKTAYRPDGTKSLEIPLINGVLHGVRRTYYESGKVKEEEAYKDGKQDGLVKSYYRNGNVKYEGEYKDGKMSGLQKWYYENGNLKTVGHYTNNKEDGHFKWYNEDGSLKAETTY